MRKFALWAVALCPLLMLAACADSPTAPHGVADRALPAYETQTVQGCVTDGLCLLPPISGGGSTCDPYLQLDWNCDDGDGDCMTSALGGNTDTAYVGLTGCIPSPTKPGGGIGEEPQPEPEPGEEEYSDICPQPILGKVATALVPIAGRNHEFKFEGPFWRVNSLVGRSPAWYKIPRPTLSKDDWWMAESGNILLVCWGRYTIVLGTRTWVGTMYVQSSDLHVVMGPGHPDF